MGMSSKEKTRRHRARRIENNLCVRCGENKPWKNGQMCRACLNKHNEWYKTSEYRNRNFGKRAEIKAKAFAHYGTKCSCCGEGEPMFLAIDHINGNGNDHRKKIKKYGSAFYKWLVDQNFPEGFQVLCHNCNKGRWDNGGTCPHKVR